MAVVIVPRIIVADIDRSTEFYAGVFGFTLDHKTEYTNPQMAEASLVGDDGTVDLILMQSELEPVQQRPGFPLVFEVADIDAILDKVRSAGLPVLGEPGLWEHGGHKLTLALFSDPDGYLIELVQGGKVPLMPGGEAVHSPHPAPAIHELWG
ncbi:lactoylglutathione lyase-like protein [Nocardia nova SH22a]|uniref:Lactoylglutathione lyase-like protein n=1 Tax=Nocardia nova SH22a TaxID=1415166 RepID=W5TE61_9NOCA|nr:VOC family protein [Nocardia nova]AHH17512.1 lactoylglutathione lyase-like protein [Nocardia nova SH22a]